MTTLKYRSDVKRPIVKIGVMITFILITSLGVATADWPNQPDLNLPICTANYGQSNPQINVDGTGGAIIVWRDLRSGTFSDIYAQRVNAAGVPQWTTNGVVVCDAANGQLDPQLVEDGAGGFIIAWQDFRSGGNFDIYAQRISGSGVPLWVDDGVVISNANDDQINLNIIADGAGGAIIVWQDERNGYLNSNIYAQRVNAAGVPQWTTNGVVVCDANDQQQYPDLISNGAGGAYVTWQDAQVSVGMDIYVQGLNSSGNIVWPWASDGVVVCQANNVQSYPTIISDGGGGAIISWEDERSLGEYSDIYIQRVNASGVMQWSLNGIAVCAPANHQKKHTMVSDGAGGAIVTWSDLRSGSFTKIYAQRISNTGLPIWQTDGVPVGSLGSIQDDPDIVYVGAGKVVITWVDTHLLLPSNIYAQRLNSQGLREWFTNGVVISNAAGDQTNPRIANDGSGGAIIAWEDIRHGNFKDIYAQRVYDNGTLKTSQLLVPIRNKKGKVSIIILE